MKDDRTNQIEQEQPGTISIINRYDHVDRIDLCWTDVLGTLGYYNMELMTNKTVKIHRLSFDTRLFLFLVFITMQIWTFVRSNMLYSEFVVRLYKGGVARWMSIISLLTVTYWSNNHD